MISAWFEDGNAQIFIFAFELRCSHDTAGASTNDDYVELIFHTSEFGNQRYMHPFSTFPDCHHIFVCFWSAFKVYYCKIHFVSVWIAIYCVLCNICHIHICLYDHIFVLSIMKINKINWKKQPSFWRQSPIRHVYLSFIFSKSTNDFLWMSCVLSYPCEQSLVSHHLSNMRIKGLLKSERDGINIYYSLKEKELAGIVSVIEHCHCNM